MSSRFLIGLGGLLLLSLLAINAHAQEGRFIPVPAAELSAGYTFMRDFEDITDRTGTNFPAGWYTSGAVNLNRWMGLVGEGTGSYKNDVFSSNYNGLRMNADARVYTLMGGPRFFYKRGRFVPYAQVLAGAAHWRVNSRLSGLITDSSTDTTTNFALQPGGGLTVFLTESIGVRVAADYRSTMDFEGPGTQYNHQLRVASGLTFNWGRR